MSSHNAHLPVAADRGAVHQFHPVVTFGDAISNHMISLQRILRGWGRRSDIICEHPDPSFEGAARTFQQYRKRVAPGDLLLLHHSMGYSPEVMEWIRRSPGRKVLIYHNITPADYFAGVNSAYREAAWLGRQQLKQIIPLVDQGWGDSEYNCRELVEAGLAACRVLPIVFDPSFYDIQPDLAMLSRLRAAPGPIAIFVGRVVPNKRLEDVILAFQHLKSHLQPKARLYLIGSSHQMQPYLSYLETLVAKLALMDVHLVGHVSKPELVALYQCADLFVCMSEHEGFGVPLIEAMHFGVPVVAYASTAVPETMGNAGIQIIHKDFAAVAELLGMLLENGELRMRVIAQQKERVKHFYPASVAEILAGNLESLA